MSSQVQSMQKQVAQLRQEANIQRMSVSEAVGEMVKFMNEHSSTDMLVTGMGPSENPFRDQKGCTIL